MAIRNEKMKMENLGKIEKEDAASGNMAIYLLLPVEILTHETL